MKPFEITAGISGTPGGIPAGRRLSLRASATGKGSDERGSSSGSSSKSWRSIPLRSGQQEADQTRWQANPYKQVQGNAGPMQAAVWVDTSERSIVSSDSANAQAREVPIQGLAETPSVPRGATRGADGNSDPRAFRSQFILRGEQSQEPASSANSSQGKSSFSQTRMPPAPQNYRPRIESSDQRARPSGEWSQDNPERSFERGTIPGMQQEQPTTSGRQEQPARESLGGIFRGRKFNFWSRGSSQAASNREPTPNRDRSGTPQGNVIQPRPPEDDWAANEVVLHEEEDGWGGSYMNKQASQSAWQPDQRSSSSTEASSRPRSSREFVASQQEGGQDYGEIGDQRFSSGSEARNSQQPSREFEASLRKGAQDYRGNGGTDTDEQQGKYSQSDGYGQPGQDATQPDYSSNAERERILDAEVLEDADWEATEEDWEQGVLPDITPLAPDEADELLPIIPTPDQMSQNWGNAVDFGQRAAAALAITILVTKFNLVLLASGSATFVFWGPVLGALNRNRVLRSSGRFVGLWRATVKAIQMESPERRAYGNRRGYEPVNKTPTLKVLVGDDSGARSQLLLPYNRRYEAIQVGEAAELLVLSPQSGFNNFKALKEIYLPESGLWLSDYPHINRNLFLEVSLDIERERKMAMAEGAYEIPA